MAQIGLSYKWVYTECDIFPKRGSSFCAGCRHRSAEPRAASSIGSRIFWWRKKTDDWLLHSANEEHSSIISGRSFVSSNILLVWASRHLIFPYNYGLYIEVGYNRLGARYPWRCRSRSITVAIERQRSNLLVPENVRWKMEESDESFIDGVVCISRQLLVQVAPK